MATEAERIRGRRWFRLAGMLLLRGSLEAFVMGRPCFGFFSSVKEVAKDADVAITNRQ